MLKPKTDAQPQGVPEGARSAVVRIDGVSAPQNMKIGLVTTAAQSISERVDAVAEAPKFPQAPDQASDKVRELISEVKPAVSNEATTAPPPVESVLGRMPAIDAESGMLPKLGLAAAGLAIASAMLLYFQFGGEAAETTQVAVAEPTAATEERQLSGGLTGTDKSGEFSSEDALVARITAGTLAALRSQQPEVGSGAAAAGDASASAQSTALFNMVMTASAQGQSDAYIDQLVNGAFERREISVPASLIGANGRVDTATLLALFVGN